MLDVIDGIVELLEPENERIVKVDDSGAEPLDYAPDTLYVFEAGDNREQAGHSPSSDLARFTLVAILTVDDQAERAKGRRMREVSQKLDTKREEYLRKVRRNRTGPLIMGDANVPANSPLWGNLTGAANPEFIRALDVRGLAITLTGWRLVEDVNSGG